MSRVIRSFVKFDSDIQESIYSEYSEGDLERASFPYQGKIADGVIYVDDSDSTFLIPISTIINGKAGSSKDLEDEEDDDDDSAEDVVELEIDDDEEDEDNVKKVQTIKSDEEEDDDDYDDE